MFEKEWKKTGDGVKFKKINEYFGNLPSQNRSDSCWLVRLPERENLERFVCGVFRSRTFLSILSFRPLLKHKPPPQHHLLFYKSSTSMARTKVCLFYLLTLIFYLLLIFVIVVVVAHYVANRTQIDWRWVSLHVTFTFLFQLTIFVFFLLSIQVKHLVNNSQPRLPGRLHRYVLSSPSSSLLATYRLTFFFLSFLLLDRYWRSQEAP